MIRILVASVCLLLNAHPARASAAGEVEKFLDGVMSWSAEFAQTIDDGHGNVVRSTSVGSASCWRTSISWLSSRRTSPAGGGGGSALAGDREPPGRFAATATNR